MRNYEFDGESFDFRKERRTFLGVLGTIAKYFLVTVSLAIVYYIIFSSIISTDTERKLKRENKMYEKVYPQLLEKEDLVGDVISNLQIKDNKIYNDVFNSQAPGINPGLNMSDLSESENVPDKDLVEYTWKKAAAIDGTAAQVEENFRQIFSVLEKYSDEIPPLASPIDGISYAQFGASVGEKMNPFYKVPADHQGLDVIASQGDPVRASASGFVTKVTRSRKGLGNVVEVEHPSGYITRYCHLSDIEVRPGQRVQTGKVLGYVGISGNSYVSHLHYEVQKDSVIVNPIHYFFASVSPEEYINMLYMSVNSGQSLD